MFMYVFTQILPVQQCSKIMLLDYSRGLYWIYTTKYIGIVIIHERVIPFLTIQQNIGTMICWYIYIDWDYD